MSLEDKVYSSYTFATGLGGALLGYGVGWSTYGGMAAGLLGATIGFGTGLVYGALTRK